MTITLELTEEQERLLVASAQRHDEATLRQILAQALECAIDELLRQPPTVDDQDKFAVLADRLARSFAASSDAGSLPDDALTRDGIYGDHP